MASIVTRKMDSNSNNNNNNKATPFITRRSNTALATPSGTKIHILELEFGRRDERIKINIDI